MPKKRRPKYCGPHNPSGLGYVWHKGKQVYFKGAPWGTRESYQMYDDWCRKNVENDTVEYRPDDGSTVATLALEFLRWSRGYHDEREYDTFKRLVNKYLLPHCGTLPASEFGPRALVRIREAMIDDGYVRTSINHYVQRIRRIFKWGVGHEMIPDSTYGRLALVEGLRKGKTRAREGKKVLPVSLQDVAKTIKSASPVVAAMIRVQWRTGMRSSNLCDMRPVDLDRTGDIWLYRPERHKNDWREDNLVIPIGPRTKRVLLPFLDCDDKAFLFSPTMAARWHHRQRNGKRPDTLRSTNARIREKYDTKTFRQAVRRAAKKAQVEPWTPHQLRHSAATEIRRRWGLEGSQVYLGHSSADVTQIYAERDLALAMKIAREFG